MLLGGSSCVVVLGGVIAAGLSMQSSRVVEKEGVSVRVRSGLATGQTGGFIRCGTRHFPLKISWSK